MSDTGAFPVAMYPQDAESTRGIGIAHRTREDLTRHVDEDRAQFKALNARVNSLQRFQWFATGATMAVVVLLCYVLATATTAIKATVHDALKESGLGDIPPRVMYLEKEVDQKATGEGVRNLERRIQSVEEDAHDHGKRR